MKKDVTLVILAAGMGSRFGGLKQIEPMGPSDEFIIDYSVYDAIKAGFNKIVFIIKRENYELFKETIGKRVEPHIKVEYAFQELNNLPKGWDIPSGRMKPLGTAHAVLCAKDYVNEPFAMINSDDFYGRDAFIKAYEYLSNIDNDSSKYGMIGYMVANTLTENGSVKRGICNIKNNYLVSLDESIINRDGDKLFAKTLLGNNEIHVDKNTIISMNMFGFTPKIFDLLEDGFNDFLNNVDATNEYLVPIEINKYIKKKLINVSIINTTSIWYGITYKDDLNLIRGEINRLINDGVYPKNLWK